MRSPHRIAAGFAFVVMLWVVSGQGADFQAVGTYDENVTQANTVDVDTTGTLNSFTAAVAAAFAKDQGGVIDFSTGFPAGGGSVAIGTSFDVDYGVNLSKTLEFSGSNFTGNVGFQVRRDATAGQVTTISSPLNNLLPQDNSDGFTLTVGPITNGGKGEFVSEIAFTILGRNTFGTGAVAEITANYSDGSSEFVSQGIGITNNDDTFFHFVAPVGESIVGLDFLNSSGQGTANQRRFPIDDLAFITTIVPEPATIIIWSLLGLGLCGYAARRAGFRPPARCGAFWRQSAGRRR